MKILLYGLNFYPESVGIGKYTGEWSQWLAAQGYSVRVITAPPYFPQWRVLTGRRNAFATEQADGLRVQRCPLWVRGASPRKARQL